MDNQDAMELAMLSEAMQKATKLMEELKRLQADADANPKDLPPDQLAEGREALQNAIASTERMLSSLQEAAAVHPAIAEQTPS